MITINDIARFLSPAALVPLAEAAGDQILHGPAPITEAGPGQVSFCGSTARKPEALLGATRASLLIVDRDLSVDRKRLVASGVLALIESDNARLAFTRVLREFFAPPRPQGIAPTAVIAETARIAADAYIGPLCTVGDDSDIGSGSVIHSGVQIYDRVRIGSHVTIHSGCTIGGDGFGFERNPSGELEKFPQLGGVVIEDDVEIGANCCVDRGSMGDTRLCQGVCLDSLVHVAHNVVIGRHTALTAAAMIAGSTRIGEHVWIGPNASLRDRIVIGDRATIGVGAVVMRNVPDDGTVMGLPARTLPDQKRILKALTKLAGES